MAQMPALASGLNTVEPGRAPDAYDRTQASPEAFGGNMGRALQQAGAQVQQTSNVMFQTAAIYDEAAVDSAANQFERSVDALLYGDGTPGPDGQPTPGFLSLKGRSALDARPGVEEKIKALQKEINGNLKNELQKKKFLSFGEKYTGSVTKRVASYANQQQDIWAEQENNGRASLALERIARNPQDGESLAAAAHDLRSARVRNAELKGGGPELVAAAVAAADRDFIKAQTEAIAVNDPAEAMRVLEKNRPAAGSLYDELATKYRSRADQAIGLGVGQEVVASLRTTVPRAAATETATPATVPDATKISDAIIQQESGGRRDIATSINGAVGPGQIRPATFAAYAKPGERIDNADDNLAVSRRIVEDYSKKFSGDPARVAVAYFSGEGNVAPAGSETPWKRDVADGNGKTVSSYVSDVTARLGLEDGGQRPASGIRLQKADAIQTIMGRADLSPTQRAAALAYVRTYYEAENAIQQEQKRKTDEARSAFTSTFEIEMKRGNRNYIDIENAWQNGYLSDAKRTEMTLWLDDQSRKQDKITQAIGSVQAALNGGRLMDPKSTADRDAVDLHYEVTSQGWKGLPPAEVLPRAIQYSVEVGMAPTPLKQMIRGGLRSGNSATAVQASDTVRQLRNQNPQILNDFNDEDLRLATMLGTLTDYGVPPDQAYLQASEALKVPESERKNRERAYDLQRGADTKARDASDKKWMEGKLNSAWTSDPTLDPVMQSEWETVTRQEYLRTGNLDASRQYALDTVNRAWGRSEVGGDRRYMKYAPEKFYGVPTLSPAENAAWMNDQLAADVAAGAFADPSNPITPDRVTLTVDPTRVARDGRPVYQVMVKGQDGVFYAVTGKEGRALPWTPNWETSAARKRQQESYDRKIGTLRNIRQGTIAPLPEGLIR